MNNKINIVKADGSNINVDIICYIENVSTNARYVYYTLNEVMGTGASSTIKIYVSKEKTNTQSDTPINDAEWNELKGYMADALKGTSNPNVKYLPLPANIISISDKAIAMPVNYDYVNKQKGIYAQNIATIPVDTGMEGSINNQSTPVESAPAVSQETIEKTVTPETTVTPNTEPATPYKEPDFNSFNVPPISEPVINPVGPTPNMDIQATQSSVTESNTNSNLEKVNIEMIEEKYAKMIEDINRLKSQEIEAANRYNATLDLSAMHNEQHASYVANEQTKENIQPQVGPSPMTMVEPEPIISSAPINNGGMETNWFDMPQDEN